MYRQKSDYLRLSFVLRKRGRLPETPDKSPIDRRLRPAEAYT